MTLQPAGWPWLLRHEMRLGWRRSNPRWRKSLLGVGACLWIAYHVAIGLVLYVKPLGNLSPGLFVLFGALVWFAFTLMLSQAISRSVDAFFDRGDLDLVLGSPVRPRSVFVVRGLGIAIDSSKFYLLLLAPLANVGLFFGKPALLAIYATVVAMALLASAIGMALTVLLVGLLGTRRARVVAQVIGALAGAALFLASQASHLVSAERGARWTDALLELAREGGPLGPASLVWTPFDAMLGRPAALLAMLAVGIGSFVLTVGWMARRWLDGTRMTGGADLRNAGPERASRTAALPGNVMAPSGFRGGLRRVILVKEWKLIARDPQLIANTLLQTLYLLPLVFLWVRRGPVSVTLLAPLVVAAASLAAGLAWVTIAADEVPELLTSAPVDLALVRRVKMLAALAPVWLLVSPVALVLLASHLVAAFVFIGCIVGSTASVAFIQIAMPQRGVRRDLRRRARGGLLNSIMELTTMACWGGLTWALLVVPAYAVLGVIPALGLPLAAWSIGRARRIEFAGG